ncbi:MAG: RNA methyltransferase [Tenuifilaceae bacterium]|nr:RNA methyltransferase [Tenuifilaceae bacterium]
MNQRIELITSRQNPRIKNLVHLQKSSERRKQGLFTVEGIKEIEKVVASGYQLHSVFYCPDIIFPSQVDDLFGANLPREVFEVSRDVYNRIAYREDSGGVVALACPREHNLQDLNPDSNPLILVIEGVEKPGNIGAIYRTADAAGISAIILCDSATDLYNPNTIRASLGCVFTIPTAICTSQEAIKWLKGNSIQIMASYLKAATPYHKADYKKPTAIVMGTEATGITKLWVNAADANIIIPMRGAADSMNVSTATAVLVFEACRQRDFTF